ncbi:MAG: hypothetical protein CMN30_07150 [Sandaracinus sp.]|nr:hypothetical protein [Sandaracinus sp.]|tara:strand:- start:1314 stop:1805 length:492 start_codon:yes stop_codon:yes gene_type:complete
MTTGPRAILLTLALGVALGIPPSPASAGDRELEVVLVNMTPDPVSDAGRACSATIRSAFRADYTHLSTMGETAFRRAVGDTEGADFMTYGTDQLRPVVEVGETWRDAVVLFDCRPDQGHVDVLIRPMQGGVRHLRLRDVRLDDALVEALAKRMLRFAWLGFSP